jgi:hypothetical protein
MRWLSWKRDSHFLYKYIMHFKELDNFKLDDAVHFHDQLNPAVFRGDNLRDDVRQKLLIIAEDFVEHLGISDLDVADITISGSNAAYTYTAHSDIDLHILVDMQGFEDDDVYRELFDAKKTVYNDQHDIMINGYEVELYVQDSNLPVISLGEYSVLNDRWIKLPRKRKADLDQMATKLKFRKIYKLANYALHSKTPDKIQNVLRTLKKYRQAGLDNVGEFSPENLAFKALRSKGVIKKLYDKLNDLHSENLSLPENDSNVLDKKTLNVDDLARKHRVSKDYLLDQLMKGIGIESEHTNNFDIAAEIALDHLGEDPNYYVLLKKANLEECGYIPSESERNDPRFKTALTVDITPNSIKDNARKLGSNIQRDGRPPLLDHNKENKNVNS